MEDAGCAVAEAVTWKMMIQSRVVPADSSGRRWRTLVAAGQHSSCTAAAGCWSRPPVEPSCTGGCMATLGYSHLPPMPAAAADHRNKLAVAVRTAPERLAVAWLPVGRRGSCGIRCRPTAAAAGSQQLAAVDSLQTAAADSRWVRQTQPADSLGCWVAHTVVQLNCEPVMRQKTKNKRLYYPSTK